MSDSPAVILYGTDPTGSIGEKGIPGNPVSVSENITSTGGFYPDYFDAMFSNGYGVVNTTSQDSAGNLKTRGAVLTDEGSMRDDFAGSSLDETITGTATFTNGSVDVLGAGTLFLTEMSRLYNIRKGGDSSAVQQLVAAIVDDTHITLRYPYEGTSGSGTVVKSIFTYITGSGGSVAVSTSECVVSAGMSGSSTTAIHREVDYGPLILNSYFSISQRIADQETFVGFADADTVPTEYGLIVFDGTDNTKAYLRTGGNAGDTETSTTFTLPNDLTTATKTWYRLELSGEAVTVYVDGVALATNRLHIPNFYTSLGLYAGITNTGVPASNTNLSIDTISVNNLNIVQVGGGAANQPLNVALGGLDDAGVYKVATVKATQPDANDYATVTRTFLPTAISVSHGSSDTAALGSSWTVLSSSTAHQVTVLNSTPTDIEVRRNGAGVGLPVVGNSYWVFRGVANANELSMRRIDQDNAQITIHYELES